MAHKPSNILRHRKKRIDPSLMLTPMVDVFVCLLLFLLQSFSAGEDIIVSDKDFQLPYSIAIQEPHAALTVKVNEDVIVVGDRIVGSSKEIIQSAQLMIPNLFDALSREAERTKYIASKNPSVTFRGDIIIQGDHNIPFLLLKKIMYTCSRAEFGNISLAVLQKQS